MIILALDPSGNFNEGKGTTGWCILNENKVILDFGVIKAETCDNVGEYTDIHINLIKKYNPDLIVMEDFKLYADKAKNQINSRFETPKLIGVIEHYCYKNKINLKLQAASEVKSRWSDSILLYNNIITQHGNKYIINDTVVSEHTRDAIRHGIHYITYKLWKKQ